MNKLVLSVALLLAACAQQNQGGGTPPAQQPREPATGPQEITVQAVEYEYRGIPDTLTAGPVGLTMENSGAEPHQFGLVRINSDHTVEELLELQNRANRYIDDVGHAFARPGKTDQLTRTLEPGRYGYACFVTTKQGKPHAMLGMYGEFRIEAAA